MFESRDADDDVFVLTQLVSGDWSPASLTTLMRGTADEEIAREVAARGRRRVWSIAYSYNSPFSIFNSQSQHQTRSRRCYQR
jgi:hypothetical protein